MNLLVLSKRVPPDQRPQAYLIGKLLSSWPDNGMLVTLISANPALEYPGVNGLVSADPSRMVQRITNRVLRGPFGGWFRRTAIAERGTLRLASRLVERGDVNLIFSFSNPFVTNILGCLIKERYGLPFVAHYSDPFRLNVYKSRTFASGTDGFKTEARVLSTADAVVFVNEQLRDFVLNDHDSALRTKAHVIHHTFDGNMFTENISVGESESFTIRHIGAFYGLRKIDSILDGLLLLRDNSPDLFARVRLEIHGGDGGYHGSNPNRDAIERRGLSGTVTMHPQVGYLDSLKLMSGADALLSVDAGEGPAIFLPSKMIDYLGAGRPVIVVTQQGSPASSVVAICGGVQADVNDSSQIASAFARVITDPQVATPDHSAADRYSLQSATRKWRTLFETVLERG